ncbi:hypothetical protein L3Q82_017759, partial [Scortum barcoo]
VTGQTKSGSQAHHEQKNIKDCYVARIGVTRGPTLEPGLGLGLTGERLVAGSLPTGPGRAQPENGNVGPPSSRLTTRRKVHEGPVQCGLGSSRGRGPRRPNPWTKTLAIGTWNVTSELPRGVHQWHQDTLGQRSMIDFVVVSSDLRPYMSWTLGEVFNSHLRKSFSQIPREAGDIESEWTRFSASIVDAASVRSCGRKVSVRLKKESYRTMLACGTPDTVDRYRQVKQAICSPDGPGGKNSGLGGVRLPWEGLRQGTGEENSADSRPSGFRRNNAVFVLVVEHWTSSIPSTGCLRVYGSLPNQSTCALWIWRRHSTVSLVVFCGECSVSEYGVRGAFAKGCSVRSLYGPEQELGSRIAGRFLGVASQGPEGVRFGNHRISSLLFADDVVLMVSSGQDLQHVLERFAAECEAAGMRISTSKSEAMVLDRKRVACPLRVGGEVLPQVEEFKYLRVLFTSEGKMEREIDRRIGAARPQLCGRCTGPSW